MNDHQPNDLSHLSDTEFNALCPQGEHAPGPAMTDFRALCAELTEALDQCQRPYGDRPPESVLVWKARAALAEQPVGPTDEELWEAWGCFEHEPFSKGDTIMQLREFLACWGQP
jgi:hypothetical protein